MLAQTILHFLLVFLSLIFKVSCQGVSLTFAIDDTLSMGDDIAQVRTQVDSIMDIVLHEKSSLISNIVLVTFNDPELRVRKITKSREELKMAMSKVEVHNHFNYDCPEMALSGIKLALESSLPGSYIYVFTDASAKDYYMSDEIQQLCQRTQSQVVFVLTGECGQPTSKQFQVYYEIATASSGLAFRVEKNEVTDVINSIRETIKGNKTVLTSKTTPPNEYTDVPFTIDGLTEYAIVSASGTDVALIINGPSGTHLDMENLMWTRHGKVVKIKNPYPGKYVATVKGSSAISVVITGRSDFLFRHGFSEQEPKSIDDTAPQPLSDTLTQLSFTVKDPKKSVRIQSAQILDMKENVIKEFSLKELSPNFYTTEQFAAPSDMFKVAVIGEAIQTGKSVRRIAKTPVTPQKAPDGTTLAKAPVVEIKEGASVEVARGAALTLTCKVSAYPTPEITWRNDKGITVQSTSSRIQIPYDYISYLKIPKVSEEATYHCHAKNVLNKDQKSVKVVTKDPITVNSVPMDIIKIAYGATFTLKCDVTSPLPLEIKWYHENKSTGKKEPVISSKMYSISSDGKQLKCSSMDVDLDGKYTCKAYVRDNSDEQKEIDMKIEIYGLEVPSVTGIKVQKVTAGAAVSVKCNVIKGVPIPKLRWQFMSKRNGKFVDIANTGNESHIANVTAEHSGYYKCIATNNQGTDEHVVQLIVQVPARIITEEFQYLGMTGDIALRVPCHTIGYPRPVVEWDVNSTLVIPGNKYAIEDGALIIKNPRMSDSDASYTCTASNIVGSDFKQYEIVVNNTLNDYGVIHDIYLLKDESTTLKCNLPRLSSSQFKWFKNGREVKFDEPYINIKNAHAINDDGDYTCHVTDVHGSASETFAVDVGYPPRFKYLQNTHEIEWSKEPGDYLRCNVHAKPAAKVDWILNGEVYRLPNNKPVSVTSEELEITAWGHYKCNVSNVHGAVQREFDVIRPVNNF